MAALNLTSPAQTGTVEAFVAASAGGDSFPLPRSIVIAAKNAGGVGRTITVVAQSPCNHGVLHSQAIAVAAGQTVLIPVPDGSHYKDANGKVQLTYDAEAGLSLAAY